MQERGNWVRRNFQTRLGGIRRNIQKRGVSIEAGGKVGLAQRRRPRNRWAIGLRQGHGKKKRKKFIRTPKSTENNNNNGGGGRGSRWIGQLLGRGLGGGRNVSEESRGTAAPRAQGRINRKVIKRDGDELRERLELCRGSCLSVQRELWAVKGLPIVSSWESGNRKAYEVYRPEEKET